MSDRLTQIGDRLTQIGEMRREDVSWMIDEIERLNVLASRLQTLVHELEDMGNADRPDLKRVLRELGNRLVVEHRWEPGLLVRVREDEEVIYPAFGSLVDAMFMSSTDVILALMYQLNWNPKMRAVLSELGMDYPEPEEGE